MEGKLWFKGRKMRDSNYLPNWMKVFPQSFLLLKFFPKNK